MNEVEQNKPERELTHFTQVEKDLCDDFSGDILILTKLLEGRGQPGLAGFFAEWLIKVDDSATCLMEGSAGFAQSLIPKGYESSVNFAHAGTLNSKNSSEAISIQKKAEGYQPWDEVIYGHKRNPKTPVSYECIYQNKILENIENMHDNARYQLAVAIFISTLVGDESIHTGQFMAKKVVSSSGEVKVTDIMRIDFGARERFARQRLETKDFKHQTSDAYKGSGQLGKDYVSYLLANADVKEKYLRLWAREMNFEALGEESKQEFMRQTNNIPQEKLNEALEGVWKTLSLKSTAKKPEPLTPEAIGNLLKDIVITRAKMMQRSARDELAAGMTGAPNKEENKEFGLQIKDLILKDRGASVMLFDSPGKVGFKDVSFTDKKHANEFRLHFPEILCIETFSAPKTCYAFMIPKEQLKEKLASLHTLSTVKEMLNSAQHQCNVLEIKRMEIVGQPVRYQFFLNDDPSIVEVFTKAIFDLKIFSESKPESKNERKKCYPVKDNSARSSMIFSESQFIQLQNALWPGLNLPVPPVNVLAASTFGQSQQFFVQPGMPDIHQQFLFAFRNQKFDDPNIVDNLLLELSKHTAMDSLTKLNIIEGAFAIVERKCNDALADGHIKKLQDGHIEKLRAGYNDVFQKGLNDGKSNQTALCQAFTTSKLMANNSPKETVKNNVLINSFLR